MSVCLEKYANVNKNSLRKHIRSVCGAGGDGRADRGVLGRNNESERSASHTTVEFTKTPFTDADADCCTALGRALTGGKFLLLDQIKQHVRTVTPSRSLQLYHSRWAVSEKEMFHVWRRFEAEEVFTSPHRQEKPSNRDGLFLTLHDQAGGFTAHKSTSRPGGRPSS